MSDAVKVAGLCCLAVMFSVALALGYEDIKILGSIIGLFSLIVGGGSVVERVVRHVLRIN